jgi:hypothetical protein
MSNPYDNPPAEQPNQNPYGQGEPSAPYGQPTPYGQPAPYGQPYGAVPAEHPQGTLILVFGIIGIFSGIFAPIAWYMGSKAKKEIAASGAHYSNEQNINIGRVLGKVFTFIYIAGIVLTIVFSIIIVIAGMSQSTG